MVTPYAIENAIRAGGVTFRPPVASPRQQAPMPVTRQVAPVQARPSQRGGGPLLALAARAASTPTAQKRAMEQAQKEAAEKAPTWAKGLGVVLGNPVTRALLSPLEYMSYPRKAIEVGTGELATRLPEFLQGPATLLVDPERVEADTRSNWAKIRDPDYGFGQIQRQPSEDDKGFGKIANRGLAFGMDVLLDPTTYLAGPAMKTVEGANAARRGTEAAQALNELNRAHAAMLAAREAAEASGGHVDDIARLAAEGTEAAAGRSYEAANAAYAAERAAPGGVRTVRAGTSKNERLQQLQEVTHRMGPEWTAKHNDEIARVANRGFGAAKTKEVRDALGLLKPQMQIAGAGIPGTELIAKPLQRAGSVLRGAVNDTRLLRPLARVPEGAEASYADLIGRGSGKGNTHLALTDLAMKNAAKEGKEFESSGMLLLGKFYKEHLKGRPESAVREMVQAAETRGVDSPLNPLFKTLANSYQRISGKTIEPFLRDQETYVPHIMKREWRRWLRENSDDPRAVEFLKKGGFGTKDTLEGSMFLDKARAFDVGPGGTPKVFEINGREITLSNGRIDELNAQLNHAFPEFGGSYKFYEDDPVQIVRDYVRSLGSSAGKERATRMIADSANPLGRRVEGDLLEALREAEANVAAQNPVAEAVRAGYNPADIGAPTAKRPAMFTSDEARAAVPEGAIDPADFFKTKSSKRARRQLQEDLTSGGLGKAYVESAAEHASAQFDELVLSLKNGRERIINDLTEGAAALKPDVTSKALAEQIKDTEKALKILRKTRNVDQGALVEFLQGIDQQIAGVEDQISTLTRLAREDQSAATRAASKKLRTQLRQLYAQERELKKLANDTTPIADAIRTRVTKLRKTEVAAEKRLKAAMARRPPHPPERVQAAKDLVDHISIHHDAPEIVEIRARRIVTADQNHQMAIAKAQREYDEARAQVVEALQNPGDPVVRLGKATLPIKPGSEQSVIRQLDELAKDPSRLRRSAAATRVAGERTLPERVENEKLREIAEIAAERDVALTAPIEMSSKLRAKRSITLRDARKRLRLLDEQIDSSQYHLQQDRANLPGIKAREKEVTRRLEARERYAERTKVPKRVSTRKFEEDLLGPTQRFYADEMKRVAAQNPLLSDAALNDTESLLSSVAHTVTDLNFKDVNEKQVSSMIDDAYNGKLPRVMVAVLNDGWKALHSGPIQEGDIILDAELAKRFQNTYEIVNDPKLFGRTWNAATNLFKTYATLTPGFHVRNAMGGIFMNTSDGVPLIKQYEGFKLWKQYMEGGDEWVASQPQRIQDAITAATTSGAGGRFLEAGIGEAVSGERLIGRAYNRAADNRLTRFSQRQGSKVEGGLRLGMALDSIDQGNSIQAAYQRIARIHFDYSDVSKFDQNMKRLVPFWTFMSRNLPLQVTQMWTKPRVYQMYQNFARNFASPDEEFTPEYWSKAGAWNIGFTIPENDLPILGAASGLPVYAKPDLGFNRMQSEIENLQTALQGDFGGVISSTSPFLTAPAEFATRQDFFTGQQFPKDQDFVEPGGIFGRAEQFVAARLGLTNDAGQVDPRFYNFINAVNPLANRGERLAPQLTMGEGAAQSEAERRQFESIMRFFGAPMGTLTPKQQQNEALRRRYEAMDKRTAQRQMRKTAAAS